MFKKTFSVKVFMHLPVNYASWNLNGQGKNIYKDLNLVERKIWDGSLEFQDKRNDLGHAEFVTYFALDLINQISHWEQIDREIIVPAAILHDTGWSQMSSVEIALFYDKNWEKYELVLRQRHQEEGVAFAERALNSMKGIDKSKSRHILEIISQHDTRKDFYSLADGVVRDADKLWRYTLPHARIAMKERGWSAEFLEMRMNSDIDKAGFFYLPISKDVAGIELKNVLGHL